MRTRLYTLAMVACSLSASAQRLETRSGFSNTLRTLPTPVLERSQQAPRDLGTNRDVVWSEDFSNGMAGNNPSGAWTVSGANGNIWRVDTTAPAGFYSPAAVIIIESTTAANGFAKFASDSANCSWNGNTPTPLPTSQFVEWEGSLVSPVIDLSANPNVEIIFQQCSRYCCDDSPFYLELSADGGLTWPDSILTNPDIAVNQNAPPTETRRFDISATVGLDPSNFRFRFRHNGTQGTSHYYWQVDDIQIAAMPESEIRMNYGYVSSTGDGEEYGRIPMPQLPNAMNMGAELFNYGTFDQTNVRVECSVVLNSSGEEVFSYSTDVGLLEPGATFMTSDDVDLPELGLGLYTATFTVTSDQTPFDSDPSDNVRQRTFEVTTELYSLDNIGNHPVGQQQVATVGSASFADNSENVKLLTMYMLSAPMTVTGIEVDISTRTQLGSRLMVSILDTADVIRNPPIVNNPVNGAESEMYTITAHDMNMGIVQVPLIEPVTLPVGGYYATASLFTTNDSAIYVVDDVTVPQPAMASALWIPFDPENNQNLYGGNGTAWCVRLTGSTAISIPEVGELEGISMFPNPTNGLLRVNGKAEERYTAEVMNMLGEVVLTTRFNGNGVLGLERFAAGIYSVRISNGTQATVQRISKN